MERNFTTREQELLQLADERFGADARFTYVNGAVNREKQKIVIMSLREALNACKYIVDESNEEVMNILAGMHEMTQRVNAARARRVGEQAVRGDG